MHEFVRENRVYCALEAICYKRRRYLNDDSKQIVFAHHGYRPCKQDSHLGKLYCRRRNDQVWLHVIVRIFQTRGLFDSLDALCYKRKSFDNKVVDFLRDLAGLVCFMDLVDRVKAAHLLLLRDCPRETKMLLKFDFQYVKRDAFALGAKDF